MIKDYYKILKVPPTATQAEIARGYKELAKHWHPDRNAAKEATERMQEINEAYLILRDPHKRARYDEVYVRTHGYAREQERHEAGGQPKGANQSKAAEPAVDAELEGWIAEARHKAKEMLQFTVEETGNIVKESIESGLSYLIIPGIFAMLMLMVSTCN